MDISAHNQLSWRHVHQGLLLGAGGEVRQGYLDKSSINESLAYTIGILIN